ncbi:polymorphic toxin MafB class 1, partial [Enterobacter hormaechei subsp. steigerwaltii]|nr:polymorphic toxin MafB class 1 [Enterobacter hormaechei subsp. steigerwaltii]
INGVAAGALNPFISAGEALGIGDILYGTRYAIDKAAMRNIAPLPAEGKFAVIGGLGSVAGFEKNTREAVDRWIQENPNAAETVEAVFNVAAAAKVAKLAKAAKPGKAAVSGDFSDSYKSATMGSRYNQMNQPRNPNYQSVRNIATEINGRQYSGHALDRMQDRGIMPSVIENTIQTGQQIGIKDGKTSYYDSKN